MAVYYIEYKFQKPRILSEQEYNSLKQMFYSDPSLQFKVKDSFWTEFDIFKYLLIGFLIGIILYPFWSDAIYVINSFLFLLFLAIVGNSGKIFTYINMSSERKKYLVRLKNIIRISKNYNDFSMRYREI